MPEICQIAEHFLLVHARHIALIPHDRSMAIVLSHKTSWLFHHARNRPNARQLALMHADESDTFDSPPTRAQVRYARALLESFDIPAEQLETLDVLIPSRGSRGKSRKIRYHVCTTLAKWMLIPLAPGVYVESIELSLIHAATWMSRWELIEFLYETMGQYTLNVPLGSGYRKAIPKTSLDALLSTLSACPDIHGAKRLRDACTCARAGSRSPMETALAMLIVLPKSEGGLGLRSVKMDHRFPIPERVRDLTRYSCFYFDIFIEAHKIDFEYDGSEHKSSDQLAADHERDNTLRVLGYTVCRVSFTQLASPTELMRTMRFIASRCRCALDPELSDEREALRRFVLRNLTQPEEDDALTKGRTSVDLFEDF